MATGVLLCMQGADSESSGPSLVRKRGEYPSQPPSFSEIRSAINRRGLALYTLAHVPLLSETRNAERGLETSERGRWRNGAMRK